MSLAQKQESIRADWLAMDVANIGRILPQLKSSEPLTPAKLRAIFGDNFDETDLGFGGRKFAFSKPGGYTSLRVTGFAFIETIGNYEISLDDSDWSRIGPVLTAAWKRSSDLEFKEWKEALEIVRNMDLQFETCDGCIVSHKTPKQIIADWPF